jgi:hypothetical protein
MRGILLLMLCFSSAQAALSVSQVKVGVLRNDVRGLDLHHHYEKGKNVNVEALFPELSGGFWDWMYPAYGRLLMKICAPGAHVLKVRSAPVLDLQQHSPHMLNRLIDDEDLWF